ncbi:MAG: DUF1232 domain-containing protein [Chitinophagaceae bacterium]|nr:DUF1232 domain-containing protein [Chitinophagaceae bacterium]
MSFNLDTNKDKFVAFIGILSLLYLLNFSFGAFELLPDHLPIIGNIDEGIATTILLTCLNYFGVNLSQFFTRKKQ